MTEPQSDKLLEAIAADLNVPVRGSVLRELSHSALNQCFQLSTVEAEFFVKANRSCRVSMLEAEAEGLATIAATGTITVPGVHATGVVEGTAYLVLDLLPLKRSPSRTETERANQELGWALAAMHRHSAPQFGWCRDNTIGLTAQINDRTDAWWPFFRDRRLGVQRQLLIGRGVPGDDLAVLDQVMVRAEDAFANELPVPSLVHGDLWGGNWGILDDGSPCVFDPAVYFGDAETDIAMTRMFGGFGENFYAAYRELRPDTAAGPVRRELYRLYHWLNHWNLFGGSYASAAVNSMRTVLQLL